MFGQFVAGLADVGVHPEHLVQDDDGGSRQGFRPHDVGAKRTVPAFYGEAILHCALPGWLNPYSIHADPSGIGGFTLSGSVWLLFDKTRYAASSMSLAVSFG